MLDLVLKAALQADLSEGRMRDLVAELGEVFVLAPCSVLTFV